MAETPAVCPQLHLPLQSGSDRVLTAMRRGYSAERYLERLGRARATRSTTSHVTTDLIVGFPGESDAEFDETLEVVARAPSSTRPTPSSSRRARALAAADDDRRSSSPTTSIKDRFERLKEVLDRSALRKHEARVGRREEVLVEGPSRRNDQMLSGRTRQGKLIHFAVERRRRCAPGRW